MKLLFILRNCRAYYRFIAPLVSELMEEMPGNEIALIAPDVNSFPNIQKHLISELYEPVQSVRWSTKKFMDLRGLLVYIYWALLGVQSEHMLDRLGDKFFYRPLSDSVVGKIIKEKTVIGIASFLRRIGLNVLSARFELAFFRLLESLTSPENNIVKQIKDIAPDMILITPAIYPQSFDIDYLKAGLCLHVPTIAMIASWDHLTSKGLLSVVPDRVMVWNDMQVQEAQKYHSVSADRILVTGAPVFDRMFQTQFLQSRSLFCESAKLDHHRPFVLWAASSQRACEDEAIIVERFLWEMRKQPSLDEMQVLIRPHPNAVQIWKEWNVDNAPVWSTPGFIDSEEAQTGLYNSIYHAQAVLGLSTSLFLETAILERPCALLKSSLVDKQVSYNKLIHFSYWLENGFPVAVEDEADCVRWLVDTLLVRDRDKDMRERFIHSFIRPLGIDRPAANVACQAIVELANPDTYSANSQRV